MYVLVILPLLIAPWELIPLYKNKQMKEFRIYSVAMVFLLMIGVLLTAGINLPRPADYIEQIISTFITNNSGEK